VTALLELSGLDAFYGTAQALFGIDLEVPEGAVVALLGRNGAGKTTTMRAVMRLQVHTSGAIRFAGRDLTRLDTTTVARAGIAYVPEDRRIFARMTVRENLELGRRFARGRPPLEPATVLGAFPDLEPLLERRGGVLSGGEQQMLAIARALVGNPTLMLLDEPSEGLAPIVVARLGDALREIHRSHGLSVLLAEQNTPFAVALADRIVLIDSGRVVWRGTPAELGAAPETMRRVLGVHGREPGAATDTAERPAGPA